MSCISKSDGTIELTYYNQRSHKETIKFRQNKVGDLISIRDKNWTGDYFGLLLI